MNKKNDFFIFRLGLFVVVILLLSSVAFPQAYAGRARIRGVVTDEQGQPLAQVRVKLYHVSSDSGFETKTDDKGEWSANMIRGGTWYIDFNKTGYEPKKISIQVSEGQLKAPVIETKMKKLEGLVLSKELLDELEKGNALFDKGNIDEALAVYQDMISKYPDAYVINYSIGNCYFKKEDYDQAIAYYQKVIDKNPQFVPALIALGNAYVNKKDIDKAMEWYSKLDIAKIDDPVVLYNIGTIYFNHSRHDQALKYYQKAVEIQPDFTDAIYQLGLTQLTLGNYKDALTTFQNYLKYDSESERSVQVKNFIEFLKTKI
ncbi:MAG: tetratricopeptide repeat protein [Candidatus Aminicenantes bacterium]|jgi:FOG: TPR repeat|nr:tetratricopeptide repeat protein [Candidatus Aminicenantes bacterium]